jgi:hypothetical protein
MSRIGTGRFPGWSHNDHEMTGNVGRFVVAVWEDTPTNTPSVNWLSLNIPSCSWMSEIEKTPEGLGNKKESHLLRFNREKRGARAHSLAGYYWCLDSRVEGTTNRPYRSIVTSG